MKERKLKIAEFIESIECSELSSTILLGGSNRSGAGIMSTTNGSCRNGDASCKGSTNNAKCENALGLCDKSKNLGICDNTFKPKPDNVASCGTPNYSLTSCG